MPQISSEIVDVYVFRRAATGAPEFLQLRRSAGRYLAGTWHPVAGRIEPGETGVAAALRELREETGLAPARFWQLEHVSTFYVARTDQILLSPSFAAEVPSAADVRLSDEHDQSRWTPWPACRPQFVWPGQRAALDEIMTEIVAGGPAEPHLRVPLDGSTPCP